MGACLSWLIPLGCDDENSGTAGGQGELPEDCLALLLSHLDHPAEICKFARLNKAFHQASMSDVVWAPRLPENHQILINKLLHLHHNPHSLTMMQIYAKLCCPSRLSGDTMEVWLDKSKGGMCVAISWKGLKITGIDDRRYWTIISTHQSRFNTVAYLHQIWWLEVEGQLGFEFPKGRYSLFFRLQLGGATKKALRSSRHHRETIFGSEKVHGWDKKPVQFQLSSSSNGQCVITSQYFLQQQGSWIDHHVGDFVVENSRVPTNLKFSMSQIDCTHTKGGLCLDSVLILPCRSRR